MLKCDPQYMRGVDNRGMGGGAGGGGVWGLKNPSDFEALLYIKFIGNNC